jgi:hypothetical protein
MTMPAGHLVGLDNPVMGAAWADFAFPPFRCDEFAIFGKFQRTIPHINLHLIDAPKVTDLYRKNVSSFWYTKTRTLERVPLWHKKTENDRQVISGRLTAVSNIPNCRSEATT